MELPRAVQDKLPLIMQACERAGVKRLWIFGSAATSRWRDEGSDVDFLVELDRTRSLPGQFLGLYRALNEIFDRRVDLVSIEGVRNPYFLEELEATRVSIYAAA